jgi:hypothetical protein
MTPTEERPDAGSVAEARRIMTHSKLRTSGVDEPFVFAEFAAPQRWSF